MAEEEPVNREESLSPGRIRSTSPSARTTRPRSRSPPRGPRRSPSPYRGGFRGRGRGREFRGRGGWNGPPPLRRGPAGRSRSPPRRRSRSPLPLRPRYSPPPRGRYPSRSPPRRTRFSSPPRRYPSSPPRRPRSPPRPPAWLGRRQVSPARRYDGRRPSPGPSVRPSPRSPPRRPRTPSPPRRGRSPSVSRRPRTPPLALRPRSPTPPSRRGRSPTPPPPRRRSPSLLRRMRTPVRSPTPPVRRKESRSPPSRSPSPPTPPRVVSRLPVRSAVHDPLEESGRGRGMFRGRGGRGAHYWARGRGARPFESTADRFPTRQPPTGPRQLMQDRMDVDPKPQPSRDRTPPPKTPPPQDTQMDAPPKEARQDLPVLEQQSVPEVMPPTQPLRVDDTSMQVDSSSPVVSFSLPVPAGSIIADKTAIEPEPAVTVTSPLRSVSPAASPSIAIPQPIAPIPSLPAHIPRRISEEIKQPSPSPSPGPSSLPSPIHMSLPVRPDHARRRPAVWTGIQVNPSPDSPMPGIEKSNGNTPTTPDVTTPRYETPSRIDPSIMRLSTPTVGTPRIESPRIPAGPRGNPRGRGGASGSATVPHATIPYVHKYATNPRVKRDLAKIDATMKHIGELRENRNALKAALDGGVSVANVRIRVTSQMDGHGRRQDTEVTRDRVVWKGPDGEWSNTVFGYTNTGIETDKPTVRQSLNELKGMVLPKTEGTAIARKRAEWELEMTRMDLAAAETRRACAERLMEAAKLGVLGIEYGAA